MCVCVCGGVGEEQVAITAGCREYRGQVMDRLDEDHWRGMQQRYWHLLEAVHAQRCTPACCMFTMSWGPGRHVCVSRGSCEGLHQCLG